jgi:hypothetical protein
VSFFILTLFTEVDKKVHFFRQFAKPASPTSNHTQWPSLFVTLLAMAEIPASIFVKKTTVISVTLEMDEQALANLPFGPASASGTCRLN